MLNSSWITSPDCNAETSHFSAAEDAVDRILCPNRANPVVAKKEFSQEPMGDIVYLHEKSWYFSSISRLINQSHGSYGYDVEVAKK